MCPRYATTRVSTILLFSAYDLKSNMLARMSLIFLTLGPYFVTFSFSCLILSGYLASSERILEQPHSIAAIQNHSKGSHSCPISNITCNQWSFIPRIQYRYGPESRSSRVRRIERQQRVKQAFLHSWKGYRNNAWLHDTVLPISGGIGDILGGWGATLVDSLDTLLIMEMHQEFGEALAALESLNFTSTQKGQINIFEMTIRHLGGLLSANDLTDGKHSILLEKAKELADMLYGAFNTSNKMPQTRWESNRLVMAWINISIALMYLQV